MQNIKHVNELRAQIAHKEEIREMHHDNVSRGCTIFCYLISAENTFDDAWARECRGIVFDDVTGAVISRPLHKFFNVNERPETQVKAIDWSKVVRVMDKRDGSLIHAVWYEGGIRLKSKKSFDSDIAMAATAWMNNSDSQREHQNVYRLCVRLMSQNQTAIFEWTAPDARIVLFYPEPELQLLHVRHNTTGEYMSGKQLRAIASEYGVKVVDEVDEFFVDGKFDAEAMLLAAKTRENVEGWVVQFENGDMVKLKTDWYLKRHRAMTFLRERDIAQLVLDEGLDDLKSLLVGDGIDITPILQVEELAVVTLRTMAESVERVYEAHKNLSRKEFALKFNDHDMFGLFMARFIGKEPEYKKYFERNVLKQMFTLRQLVLIPTVAEAE